MTAQTLPDEPNFCFAPAYDVETEVQQIRIVIEGLAGHVPTALIYPGHLEDALRHLRQAEPPARATTARPGPPWWPNPCTPRPPEPGDPTEH